METIFHRVGKGVQPRRIENREGLGNKKPRGWPAG